MLGVVVVTYNRKDLLLRCLGANLAQQHAPDIVVVVDNASTDGTQGVLAQKGLLNNPSIQYHRLDTNSGGAGGFNFGMQKAFDAGCDWVWVMDDDAIPEPDALKRLFEHLPETDEPPVLVSQVVNANGQTATGHRCRMHPKLLRYSHFSLDDYEKSSFEADMATFVGPMFHRRHFEVCGLPRADYFIYYDDYEYTYRVRRAGFRLIVVPPSRVNHLDAVHIGPSAMRGRSWEWRMYYKVRNRIHWYRKSRAGAFYSALSFGSDLSGYVHRDFGLRTEQGGTHEALAPCIFRRLAWPLGQDGRSRRVHAEKRLSEFDARWQ